jgi:hypothetical protein
MSNISLYGFIMYICGYLAIMISGFIFGLLIYLNCASDKIDKEPIIKKSKNDEIIKVIKTMKNDLIINKNKYSFIEINDIINIIIDIYIKNKCDGNDNGNDNDNDINNFRENKRQDIIKEVKIKMLIDYKNELINKIIMEKNLLNITLTINDLRSIKENIENHKKEINYLFELVNEINIIDIRICND